MRFRRRLEQKAVLDLVPCIDVIFQLVVFFMVTSTFIQTPAINLSLPQSSTSEAVQQSSFIVTVVTESEIYLNKAKYDLAGFMQATAAISREEREATPNVTIEGDEHVSYSLMIQVLDVLRVNGFKGVGLKTRIPQEQKQ